MINKIKTGAVLLSLGFGLGVQSMDADLQSKYTQIAAKKILENKERIASKLQDNKEIKTFMFEAPAPADLVRMPYQLVLIVEHNKASQRYSGTIKERPNTYKAALQFKPLDLNEAEAQYLFKLIENQQNVS